jgi:hypothetical protein
MTKLTSRGIAHDSAHRKLCEDKTFSDRLSLISSAYTKKDIYTDPQFDWMNFDKGTFDYKSIMMYPSTASAADSKCYTDYTNIDLCPLVARLGASRFTFGAAIAPSMVDVAFVKKYYRWIGGLAPAILSSAVAGPSTPGAGLGERGIERRNVVRVHRLDSWGEFPIPGWDQE